MAVIEIDGLTKVYHSTVGNIVALDHLNLEVEKNEVFAMLGPNGSGKTTTLKLLMGLIFPTEGEARVMGEKTRWSVNFKKYIGYLPEGPYFYPFLNAVELMELYGGMFSLDSKTIKTRTEELLKLVGMWERRNERVSNYSKGMMQRVGLAQAMINDPDIIFLDEPTSGLDPVGSREMRDLMSNLKARGKTVFLCSHLLAQVEQVCDRVAILHRGKLLKVASVEELLVQQELREITVGGAGPALEAQLAPMAEKTAVKDDGLLVVTAKNDHSVFQIIELVGRTQGAQLVSVTPPTKTLEDAFIEVVGADAIKAGSMQVPATAAELGTEL